MLHGLFVSFGFRAGFAWVFGGVLVFRASFALVVGGVLVFA